MTETPNRSGPFWDGIEGRAPVPRAAATLGFQFIKANAGAFALMVSPRVA
jgi:hypothetical protein